MRARATAVAAARLRSVTRRRRPACDAQTPAKCPWDLKNSAALRTYSQS
jgi:hypothetical protein